MQDKVEDHYAQADLGRAILEALEADGKSMDRLTADDLAPVDAFHIGGRAASRELAALAGLSADDRVLDVGSGIGGSARYLATEYGCSVTGIDLTAAYCDVATMLSERVGLGDRTTFRQASALAMPLPDDAFDCVWTEHVQMNIADKHGFYSEIARVLRPGGRLVFHDVFAGPRSDVVFPVPWAEVPELSSLIAPGELRTAIDAIGYTVAEWRDVTADALAFFEAASGNPAPPRTTIGLLMGSTAPVKLRNMIRNLDENRLTVLQCALRLR